MQRATMMYHAVYLEVLYPISAMSIDLHCRYIFYVQYIAQMAKGIRPFLPSLPLIVDVLSALLKTRPKVI